MTGTLTHLFNVRPSAPLVVKIANVTMHTSRTIGDICINAVIASDNQAGYEVCPLTLTDVYYVPGFQCTFIFVGKLAEHDLAVVLRKNLGICKTRNGDTVFLCKRERGIYNMLFHEELVSWATTTRLRAS